MRQKQAISNVLTLLLIIFSITQNSCNDSPIDPYANLEPGRRDYSWTADTLLIPFTYMDRIWGNTPNDIWAVGEGDADKTIYHYDGNKWTTDGISRGINPFSIWGFASDDIWIGGFGPLYHYDGANWNREFEYNNPDFARWGIQDIWGDSPDNVWAIGFADSSDVRIGIIFHYDGNSWNRVNIGFTRTTMMRIRRGRKTSNNYFIFGLKMNYGSIDTAKILEFNGTQLNEIYSNPWSNSTKCNVQEINDEMIFSIGNGLYKYVNKKFVKIFENNFPNYYAYIWGTNIKNIFWAMRDGVTHYNGTNVEYILKFNDNNIRLIEMFGFDDVIFILTNNFSTGESIIFQGKLTK